MRPPPEVPAEIVARVETLCLALPEATERIDGWAYSFEIRRRSFCVLLAPDDGKGTPVPMLVLRADPDEREVLLAIGRPYFASRARGDRLGVVLTPETDWEEMRELITESYRVLAPKKLIALLDAPS
ncbi:MAG TPA: MmcQ/YjbR family DNA-binding protein [Acidimicrobiales bacterium]|nr:MmcQ/YjbR family DNA-binding protein [Acidimicrobiales bacterium]